MNTAVLENDVRTAIAEEPAAGLLLSPEPPQTPALGEWHREARASAWQKFEGLSMPARTDEAWRFSSLKAVSLAAYTSPQPLSEALREELLGRSMGLEASAGRMVFGNDQLLTREIRSNALRQQGVLWLPIEQAAAEHGELFRRHFMREEAALGSRKFAALHEARLRNGTFLSIPRGVEIDLPIEAFHWLHGENGSCFPHTLIIAGENSKVTFVDWFASTDAETPGFACGVNDLWLGSGAKVTYVNVQQWSRKALAIQINSTVVGRDAGAVALNANFGGGYVRSESISHLRHPGGRSDMLSFSSADDRREIDQRTLQIHEAPNTASDLLYKNALDDQARTIFSGLIRVDPGAHFTDAYQKVRNLMLSDEAEANSAPGLEIEADNVRCTHGATSGEIESEELFYLLSRGIPKSAAQRLIVFGFLNEVIDRLPNEAVRERLRAMLQAESNGR
ncbi:MAG TPA: Fe-S cluster assembly protein SufD [Chthoniobacteraceae bacterium]|jgi:Fe-S cluster assembly protein SufD